MKLDLQVLSATHIKHLTRDKNGAKVEEVHPVSHIERLCYLYVLAEWQRLKHKPHVQLSLAKISAHTGMSVGSVKNCIKKWRSIDVFECKNTYKEDGTQNPLTYTQVVDVSTDMRYKWHGEYLSKWLKAQYDRAIKQAKDHTDNKGKTPSQWRTFRKNCAYEIERGQYFSGDEKALVWTKQLAPSGVVFEWTR